MNSFFCLKKVCRKVFPILLAVLSFNSALAAVETANGRVGSPALSSASLLRVDDNKYGFMNSNLSSWQTTFANKKVTDRVIFSVDQASTNFQSVDYTATIAFQLTTQSWDNTSHTFVSATVPKTLTLNYSSTKNYTDKAVYSFADALSMSIQVTSITLVDEHNTVLPLSKANLSLEAEIETERYYVFNPLSIPTVLSHNSSALSSTGELSIYWDALTGAEEYDLEWMYINNYDYDAVSKQMIEKPASSLTLDARIFQFNSTRISTTNTYYKIPYIYEKGYILYRIRGVGKISADNYTVLKEGKWSTDSYTFSTVAAFAKKFPDKVSYPSEDFISHNDNLNWQAGIDYAEEGKSKAVVNYFDGSMRDRQSVTKSKTIDQIIVGESIYDHQGRAAIQVLPVPVASSKIAFNPNFNQNPAGVPYSRADFDVDGGSCVSPTAGMRASNVTIANVGASNYYSSFNLDKVDQQGYVPDANLYPFSQVEYTPDNTGRISNQGGVGKEFQLGKNRATHYSYTTPEQAELDRLFGSEVGDALHYKKNTVRDANGQLNVSYLDPQGHVVATCLAGESPTNLKPLEGKDAAPSNDRETDLLGKVHALDFSGSKNILDLPTRSLSVDKQVTVEKAQTLSFRYEMRGNKYQQVCAELTNPVCYDCIFDLKISLTDECNNEYLPGIGQDGSGNLLTSTQVPNGTYPVPSNCNTAAPLISKGNGNDLWQTTSLVNTAPAIVQLDPNKTYTLNKTLSLNQKALDAYTSDYLKTGCVHTFEYFRDKEVAAMDFSGCNMTCQQCADSLGPYKKYNKAETPSCSPCLTHDQWQELYDQCFENCTVKSEACEAPLQGMLADVSMTGQYGQIMPGGAAVGGKLVDLDPSLINPEAYPLSVFNEGNQLPRRKSYQDAYNGATDLKNGDWAPTWRFPYNPDMAVGKQFTYINEDGSIALIPVVETAAGSGVYKPEIVSATYLEDLPNGGKGVRPQFLKDFIDFVNVWDPEWAYELVRYHPEYGYYTFCTSISASHDFDDLWLDTKTILELANNPHWNDLIPGSTLKRFMNPASSAGSTAPLDPYFDPAFNSNYQSQEQGAMLDAMTNYTTDASNTVRSIWYVAYITVHCPNALSPSMGCTLCTYTDGTNFTTDEEWNAFKSLYLSLKQKFQQQVAIRYAIKNGFYNGCIGADSFDPFQNRFFQTYQTGVSNIWTGHPWNFPFFRSQFYNFEQPCNFQRYTLYKEKQMRFPGISDLLDINAIHAESCYADLPMDASEPDAKFEKVNCPAKSKAIADESKNLTAMALYQQCGQCPNAHNLELFLNALVKNVNGSQLQPSTGIHVSCSPTGPYPEFTEDLAAAFHFTAPADIVYSASLDGSTKILTSNFGSGSGSCNVQYKFTTQPTGTAPNPSVDLHPELLFTTGAPTGILDLYTFSDITNICCLKHITNPSLFPFTLNRNFQFTATVLVKSGDPLYETIEDPITHVPTPVLKYRELIVEGLSGCFDVGGCVFDPICKPSKEALQLQTLLNSLLYKAPAIDGTHPAINPVFLSSTEVQLNTDPYNAAYQALRPYLNTSANLDPSNEYNWTWKVNSSSANYARIELSYPSKPYPCYFLIEMPTADYAVQDIIRFNNIRPVVNSSDMTRFTITALVVNAAHPVPTYIDITGNINCLVMGDCSTTLPSSMVFGSTKTTLGGIGKRNCQASPSALELQEELNSLFVTKQRSFTCTSSGLNFSTTISACRTIGPPDGESFGPSSSNAEVYLSFPVGSEYGSCEPWDPSGNLPHYYTYADIVAFSGITPDMDFAKPGVTNFHFIIYATMPNGAKIQMKGNNSCFETGSCEDEINGDCVWAENKVVNGNFEQGDVSFISEYSPIASTDPITQANQYSVVNDASNSVSYWSGKDHTSNGGKFLVAMSDATGKAVWKQGPLAVKKNTYYNFSAWLSATYLYQGFTYVTSPQVLLSITGDQSGVSLSPVFHIDQLGAWKKCELVWYSGENTQVDLKVLDNALSVAGQGYNYGLDDIAFQACQTSTLCEIVTIPIPHPNVDPDPCHTQLTQIAYSNAQVKYDAYIDGISKQFQENYIKNCLNVYEDFFMKDKDTQHHFTLYYYDQAGNLVRTIPPAGVRKVTDIDPTDNTDGQARVDADLEHIRTDRANGTHTFFTKHTMATTYKYNSLNQLVAQSTPDQQDLQIWNADGISTGIPATQVVKNTTFSDPTHGTAFTTDASGVGHIFNTVDGKNWIEQTSVGITDLYDVKYVSSSVAYAVGKGAVVLKSVNSGANWAVMTSPLTTVDLFRLVFDSDLSGRVLARNGQQWQTPDGGASWTVVTTSDLASLLTSGDALTDIKFAANNVVAVSRGGAIFTSTDNGYHWIKSTLRSVDLNDVFSIGGKRYAVGKDGRFLKSNDLGATWQQVENSLSSEFKNLYFNYASQGWILDNTGTIIKTDGNVEWHPIVVPGTSAPVFQGLSFSSPDEGYAFTSTGLYSKYNANKDVWSELTTTIVASNITKLFNIAPFATTNIGFMGANDGKIYKKSSTDAWDLWQTLPEGIADMYFSNTGTDLKGVVLTQSGHLYKYVTTPAPAFSLVSSNTYVAIQFISNSKGYALSENGIIATTTDGGVNWTEPVTAAVPSVNHHLKSIFIESNQLNGVVVGAGGEIFKTTDGTTWVGASDNVTAASLTGVAVVDANTAYAVGNDGTILKTTNVSANPANWEMQLSGSSKNLNAVFFTSSTTGVAVGQDGYITSTQNGGSTSWVVSTTPVGTASTWNDVTYSNSSWYAVGATCNSVKSSNGLSWSTVPSITSTDALNSVGGSGSNMLAVGSNGRILKHNGTEWQAVSLFIPPVINDAQLMGSYGISVGDKGSILISTTGSNWNVAPSGTDKKLNSVFIFPAEKNKAFVTGDGGTLLVTTNSGTSWSPVNGPNNLAFPSGVALNDVYFTGNFGIIVGSNGTAYTSTNGGLTWSTVTTTNASSKDLNAVYIVDQTMGFAVGQGGTILKITIDATALVPTTWNKQQTTGGLNFTTATLNDVYFKDYTTGYTIGNNKVMLKTVNGGATWLPQDLLDPAAPSVDFSNLTILDGNNLIISGSSGSVTHLKDLKDQFATLFWHDKLGRIIASQNAKQYNKTPLTYSYSLYDALGRIQETGEVLAAAPIESIYKDGFSSSDVTSWAGDGVKSEVTTAVYDTKTYTGTNPDPVFPQDNLSKRVAAMYFGEGGDLTQGYDHATHYSYDIHGNVKSLLQDNPGMASMASISQQYKRMDYEYDLVSGNVKEVSYQAGAPDAFYHKYEYDADNRITNVQTSKDRVSWDQDAKYFYYKHGPLARVELGNEKVQGIDYAYTLQGWIKGINSTNLDVANDIGKDANTTLANNTDVNVARDAYSYSLNYYREQASASNPVGKDYTSIGAQDNFLASVTNAAYMAPNLYNGNISSMATTIMDNIAGGAPVAKPQLTAYQYDQRNRITDMTAYQDDANNISGNDWAVATSDHRYESSMHYDANGNIMRMKTNGAKGNLAMDDMSYTYNNSTNTHGYTRNTNQLLHVNDIASTYTDDIDDQGTLVNGNEQYNYAYDELGNLIKDKQEKITNIEWTLYGKIKKIQYDNDKVETDFYYDAKGNRIEKKERLAAGTIHTFYVRDAEGNVMSTYKFGTNLWNNNPTVEYHQSERMIYGSKRLGIDNTDYNFTNPPVITSGSTAHVSGAKEFELDNHIENVLSTVSDRKIPFSLNTTTVSYYVADVKTAGDYYAFGAPMPKRGLTITDPKAYRYGFNGKENDNTVGTGAGTQDYGMRIYNPSLGKFLSVDPLTAAYPWNSTYAFAENDVIRCIDLDGLEKTAYTIYLDPNLGTVSHSKIELPKAGKLGNGIAVQMNICIGDKETVLYFYGEDKKNLKSLMSSFECPKLFTYHGKADRAGLLTVGTGHAVLTKADKNWYTLGCTITQAENDALYSSDLARYTNDARDHLGKSTWNGLEQNEKDAFTDMGFNKGPQYLDRYNNEGSYFIFSFYNIHKCDRKPGLIKRRVGEYLMMEESAYFHLDVQTKKNLTYLEKLFNSSLDPAATPAPAPAPTPVAAPAKKSK